MENFLAFHKNAQASMAVANASIELNTQSFSENSAASSVTPLAHTHTSTQELPAAPYFFRELKNGTVVSIGEPVSVAAQFRKHHREHGRKHDRKHDGEAAAASLTDPSSCHETVKGSSVAEKSECKQGQAETPPAGHGRRNARAVYEAMKIEAMVNPTAPPEDSEAQEQPE